MDKREEIKEALMKRALGYEYDETEIIMSGGTQREAKLKKKHMPPDLSAIKTIMNMMAYGKW